jgi:hypothetical protein
MTITNTLSVASQQVLQKHWNDVNAVMLRWQELKQELEALVLAERLYRTTIFESRFPTAEEGTNRVELGNGYHLKAVAKYNYTLANKENETERALEAMEKIGNEGAFIADRLVRWSPELSVKEYRSLAPEYKAVIDTVLTIKPGMPTLEIEAPKEAK